MRRTGHAHLRLQEPPAPGGGALEGLGVGRGPHPLGAEGQGTDNKQCLPGSSREAHRDQRRMHGLADNREAQRMPAGAAGAAGAGVGRKFSEPKRAGLSPAWPRGRNENPGAHMSTKHQAAK